MCSCINELGNGITAHCNSSTTQKIFLTLRNRAHVHMRTKE